MPSIARVRSMDDTDLHRPRVGAIVNTYQVEDQWLILTSKARLGSMIDTELHSKTGSIVDNDLHSKDRING